MTRHTILVCSCFAVMAGCATVTVDQEFSEVSEEALSRTGYPVTWARSAEDDALIRQTVQELLIDGLSRDEAVRLTLLNNRTLQTQFETLGIAKADLIQAGLYSNPSLGSLIRFPSSPGVVNTESDMLFLISDLWNVPLRSNVARVEVVRTTRRIVQEILESAAMARNTFDELLLQEALLEFVEQNVNLFQAALDESQVRFNAGLANELDIFLSQQVLYEAQVEMALVKADIKKAYADFVNTLGLDPLSSDDIHIHGILEEMPGHEVTPDQAWEFAKTHRLDLALTRLQIEQTKKLITLQKARIFGDVGLGGNYSRTTGGMDNPGLVLALEIPIFNQNQGGIARAEFQMRQAEKQLVATELNAKQELKRLLAELAFHKTHVGLFRQIMLVIQAKAEQYVDEYFDSMQFDTLLLIQSRVRNLNARRAYLNALRRYRLAESTLQVALGGTTEAAIGTHEHESQMPIPPPSPKDEHESHAHPRNPESESNKPSPPVNDKHESHGM